MAFIKTYVSLLLILIVNFHVKKLAFVSSDSIGLSIDGSSIVNERETFIMSTLWEARSGKFTFRIRSSSPAFIGLILLLCGDIEICPGPVSERRYNPEKGKTEALLFGTAQRIRKCTGPLCILHEDGHINITSTYKYLGVHLDSSLNLSSDFDAKYKKESGRLRLLAKIRSHLDIESAKAIYRAMVLPVLTYCGILNLKLNRTQENKLNSFHNRAMQLVAKIKGVKLYHQIMQLKREPVC
eukprot:gene21046-23100_t